MVKIVINSDFGGFQLTKHATELIAARGNEIAIEDLKNPCFYGYGFSDEKYRTDLDLIAVVEQLGDAAGNSSALKVVEIPDGIDWYIHEYDGKESIHECHRVWYGDE